MAAVGSMVVGFCAFIAFGAIALNGYDEKPRPWWLTSLLIVAVGLILAPMVGGVLAAVTGPFRHHRHS